MKHALFYNIYSGWGKESYIDVLTTEGTKTTISITTQLREREYNFDLRVKRLLADRFPKHELINASRWGFNGVPKGIGF